MQDAETTPSVTCITTHLYDRQGNLTRRTAPAPGAGSRHFDFAYDGADRRTYQRRPTGEQSGMAWGVRELQYLGLIHDGAGWITRATYFYDDEGHLTRQTDANGNFVIKDRDYDAYGRLTRRTDALGHYTAYDYDDLGQATRQVRYDSAGNPQREWRVA